MHMPNILHALFCFLLNYINIVYDELDWRTCFGAVWFNGFINVWGLDDPSVVFLPRESSIYVCLWFKFREGRISTLNMYAWRPISWTGIRKSKIYTEFSFGILMKLCSRLSPLSIKQPLPTSNPKFGVLKWLRIASNESSVSNVTAGKCHFDFENNYLQWTLVLISHC